MEGQYSVEHSTSELLKEFVAQVHDEVRDPGAIARNILFAPEFMKAHTGLESLDALLAARAKSDAPDLDSFLASCTSFDSFEAFQEAARRAYVARRVFDWLM